MSFKNIDVAEFEALMQEPDAVVIDVRTEAEVMEGAIEGHKFINIMSPDFRDQIDALDRDKTYLMYCRSGARSGQACMMMAGMGFTKLYNLGGGIMAWNAAH